MPSLLVFEHTQLRDGTKLDKALRTTATPTLALGRAPGDWAVDVSVVVGFTVVVIVVAVVVVVVAGGGA